MVRSSNAAVAMGEQMTPEETQLMDDNRAAEHEVQETEEVVEPAASAVVEIVAPQGDAEDGEPEAVDTDPATGKARTVNYGAFHSERERRKSETKARQAAEASAQEAKTQLATLAGRFQTIQELVQASQRQPQQQVAPQVEQIVVPDIAEDPVGHFQAQNRLLEQKLQSTTKALEDVNNWREAQTAEGQAMQNVQRLTQIAQNHEKEFREKEPSYDEAFAYVKNMRDQELTFMGYTNPAHRQQIIQQDALQIAAQALQGNMNAAEVVFNIAKSRGFAPKAPTPALTPVVQSPDAKKIATIAKGQQASQSLGQVSGSAIPETSVEALLKMSDKDFEAATKGEKWRELFA